MNFLKKKKLKLEDVGRLFELLEIQKIELVGDEGLKLGLIDYLKEKGIKIKVIKRFNKFRFY